jgi:hypothetical protein
MKKLMLLIACGVLAMSCQAAGSGMKYDGTVTIAAGATNKVATPLVLGSPGGADVYALNRMEAVIVSGTGTGTVTFAISNLGATETLATSPNLALGGTPYRNSPKYSWSYNVVSSIVTNDIVTAKTVTNAVPVYNEYLVKTLQITVNQPATNVATVYNYSITVH